MKNNIKFIPEYLEEITGTLNSLKTELRELKEAIIEFKKETENADDKQVAEKKKRGRKPKEGGHSDETSQEESLQQQDLEEVEGQLPETEPALCELS